MFDYEKLGAFYLGKRLDVERNEQLPDYVMYDAKDLTTHAVVVGMTGSGKTGLGITLLEEAAIDGIPALIIDPKGDMGNLLLNFPDLRADDFLPWVEADEALRQGLTPEEFAAETAQRWKSGLAEWSQNPDRIQRLRDAADVAIYTPGSDAGLQLTILKSLDVPPPAVLESSDALRERIGNSVSALLTLMGIDADPLRSREHILLSNILDVAWRAGRRLDLPQLIREIQTPPFTKIGIMEMETIFPAGDRVKLAMTINNLLASPAFSSWTEGEPLNIQRLLYTSEGKPRLAVLSIAHLNDQERMFFVTLLLNEVLSWMRSQPGTSSLRAILYMDEVFGYLPPVANPPSKTPLLTLLKQGRAFGLGLVLATQNPVDLDYKALSNAGTWFLGRLQTERDKARVLDGLEGASASAGVNFDRQRVEQILSGLKGRQFLLNNVHEDEPEVYQTRWALSYLRGPLTRAQIQQLMAAKKQQFQSAGLAPLHSRPVPSATVSDLTAVSSQPPVLTSGIEQKFLAVSRRTPRDAALLYRPAICGRATVHFVDSKADVDHWQDVVRIVVTDGDSIGRNPWSDADSVSPDELTFDEPELNARFADLPEDCQKKSSIRSWISSLKKDLYRSERLILQSCPVLKTYSLPEDQEGDFRVRLKHHAHEQRDLEVEKLRKKYESKAATLQDRIRRAEHRLAEEREQAQSATVSAALSFGTSILGALFGRKRLSSANVSRAATSMRSASRAADQRGDIKRAEDNLEVLQEELESLNATLEEEVATITAAYDVDGLTIEDYEIGPRKSDILVDQVSILWLPFVVQPDGATSPAFVAWESPRNQSAS